MEMWGDVEGAFSLKASDKLAKCLFQITGPAHVPYHDDRWQQLLLHYDQLVHLHNLGISSSISESEANGTSPGDGISEGDSFQLIDDVVGNACRQCAKYSRDSSNLAALTLHVARMIRDLQESIVELMEIHSSTLVGDDAVEAKSFTTPTKSTSGGSTVASSGNGGSSHKTFMKKRLALIGKARVTCGALNLLRILSHETIVHACSSRNCGETNIMEGTNGTGYYPSNHLNNDSNFVLRESFTYRGRAGEDTVLSGNESDGQDAALELISSLMAFISALGSFQQQNESDVNVDTTNQSFDALSIPEVYDVVVQMLSLQLVLLSTQLYQPFASSDQLAQEGRQSENFFLDKWMEYSHWQRQQYRQTNIIGKERMQQQFEEYPTHTQQVQGPSSDTINEPLMFLSSCLYWLVKRPNPPKRSITSHFVDLTKSVAQQTDMTIASDGMYESHSIVMARAPGENIEALRNAQSIARANPSPSSSSLDVKRSPTNTEEKSSASISLGTDDAVALSSQGHQSGDPTTWNKPSKMLINPIRNIMLLSSSLFLLPVRLVKLALRLLGHSKYRAILGSSTSFSGNEMTDYDQTTLHKLQKYCEDSAGWNRTNNILWLTDSPIADLGSSLFLLLSNNCRAHSTTRDNHSGIAQSNPFRAELATLNDNRWEKDTANNAFTANDSMLPSSSLDPYQQWDASKSSSKSALSVNFESLFEAFEGILHSENGALMLYTLLMSSPMFAASLAARSDLDTMVMPLLRTLYFSSRMMHEHQNTSSATPSSSTHSGQLSALTVQNRPFRSISQLYVVLILLLIFSQDQSFGRVAFRLLSIPHVKWYKERQIKSISLGSCILLVLLRAITFNLNRLQDAFLLSNCCAVLLNLSPHAVNLHEYVATRIVSIATSCIKRYSMMVVENGNQTEPEGDLSTLLGMHGETCRTLLQLIKHSIRPKYLEKNLHLVYVLLIDQRDYMKVFESNVFKHGELDSIVALIKKALSVIQNHGSGMSAEDTMDILKRHASELKSYSVPDDATRSRADSGDSIASDASDLGNLTFTYEEEEDPEIFFVPYVWDVVVCSISSATLEWNRDKVRVFPLNEKIEHFPSDALDEVETNEASIDTSQKDPIANTSDVV